MAYHRHHGLDTRIVRIFNSILADEQVLYDDGRELRRETAREVAARLDGQVDLTGWSVPAFDSFGGMAAAEASAFVGHRPTGPCFEVRTRYGRSIRVTGDHSLFVEGPDGMPEARTVVELRPGDRVAIAGRIDVPERDRLAVSTVEVWESAGGDPYELLVGAPGLGEVAWDRRAEIHAHLTAHRRPTCASWRNAIWAQIRSMRERDRMPLAVLRHLDMPVPEGAIVQIRGRGRSVELPAVVPVSNELLWLLGVYVAEGCWQQSPHDSFIVLSADEQLLGRAAKVIERELGLHVVRTAGSPQRSASIAVHGQLLLQLLVAPGVRRRPQADPWLDPRASAQPSEVVRRGLPRGRWRPLRPEARRGHPSRVLDHFGGAEGRSDRRPRPLRAGALRGTVRDHVQAADGRPQVPLLAPHGAEGRALVPARVGSRDASDAPGPPVWRSRLGCREGDRRGRADRARLRLLRPGTRELPGRHRRDGPQHLRAPHAAGRRAGGVELHRRRAEG